MFTEQHLCQGHHVFGSVCLSACLFVCLFVCQQIYAKTDRPIVMKLGGEVEHGPRKNPFHFVVDLDQSFHIVR